MAGFLAGLITGCLLGIAGTLVLLLLAAGISQRRFGRGRWLSARGVLLVLLVIPTLSFAAHSLALRRSAVVLLLILAVLVIARIDGLVFGLGASAVAGLMLCLFFFPPLESLLVARPRDQALLAFFLLSGILSSRLSSPRPERPLT